MRRFSIIIALFLILSAHSVSANEIEKSGRFGLGLSTDWPGLGLSTNTFINDSMSIQATASALWSFNGAWIHAEFLFWIHDIYQHKDFDLTWYAGPGLGFVFIDNGYGGSRSGSVAGTIHGQIGLAMQFNPLPFDLAFYTNVGVVFADWAWYWVGGGIATRYYF